MNPELLVELLGDLPRLEMTLDAPASAQSVPVARPPLVQFTQEELLAAAESFWVKANTMIPQVAARRKPK